MRKSSAPLHSSLFTLHFSLFNDNPSVTACAVPPPFTQGRLNASFHISCGTLIAQAISMKNPIKIGDMRVSPQKHKCFRGPHSIFIPQGVASVEQSEARVTGSPKIARFLGYIGASAQRSQKTGKIRRIFHESASESDKNLYFSRTGALKNIPMMPESADKTRSGAHALCASVRASQNPIKIARF